MKDRNLAQIIDDMLTVIPEEQHQLKANLLGVKTSSEYAAPEIQTQWWRKAAEILQAEVPHPEDEDWSMKMADIFIGAQVIEHN